MKVKILLLLCVLGSMSCQKNDAQFVTDEKEFSEKNETEISQENSQNTSENETSTQTNSSENTSLDRKEQFFRKMLNAALQGKHSVEVSEFQISEIQKVTGKDYLYATDEEYKIWFDEFKLNYPFLYHLDYWKHYSRQYNPENPQWVKSYNLEYSIPVEQMENYYEIVEKTLENYYAELHPEMTQADIAYAIYNKMIKETLYSEASLSHQPLGILANKKAVCEGYSFGYRLLMSLLGIETQVVISGVLPQTAMAHVWNRIRIDGQWYNVDATWDDNPRIKPFTHGIYFLTSDGAFHRKQNHPMPLEYYQIPPATDTRFDANETAFFRNNFQQTDAVFSQGFWFFIDTQTKTLFKAKIGEKPLALHQFSSKMHKSELRFSVGKNSISFVDFDDLERQYAIFSTDFQGKTPQRNRFILVDEVPKVSLASEKITPNALGKVALRAEVGLAKLNDAYYHGDEDYFYPKNQQRILFLKTLKEAEAFLEKNNSDEMYAEQLCKKLKTMRKNNPMGFSAEK